MKTFEYRGFFVLYERMIHNGALNFYAVRENNERLKRTFYGYTVAEAKHQIKAELKGMAA